MLIAEDLQGNNEKLSHQGNVPGWNQGQICVIHETNAVHLKKVSLT